MLILIAAVTEYVKWIWDDEVTFASLTIDAIVTYVTYFASYFIGIFFMSLVMNEFSAGASFDKRVHTFVNYSIGLLTLICVVSNFLPIDFPLLYYLPLYIIIIQWKANKYMQVPDSHAGWFVLLAAPSVLLPPFLLMFLFNYIVP
ncbi:MAG: hypothetical protein J1E63_08155 [Muribaculaceae bacterium]|nr:hypothetical protein [Muribaculaceae bacterium]